MSETVVVTGAAGFIGSSLCDALLATRELDRLVCVDNFDPFYNPAIKEANLSSILADPRVSLHRIDITDSPSVASLFEAYRPASLIHLAARAGVRSSLEAPVDYYHTNATGTLNLLNCAQKTGTRDIILASSSSVYGLRERGPFNETDATSTPISPYAAAKKSMEVLSYTFHHLYQMNISCLRFFTVYGPRQRPDLAIHRFTHAIMNKRPIKRFGDGQSARDYTYVDDIIQGILSCHRWMQSQESPRFEIFNLGSGQPITLIEMIDNIQTALSTKAIIEENPTQPGDVYITCANITKAQKFLNYEPNTPFPIGLEHFVTWLRSSSDLLDPIS